MCTVRTSFSPRKFRISTLSFSSVMLMEMGKWAYTRRILYSKPFVTPLIRFCSSKRIADVRQHSRQGPFSGLHFDFEHYVTPLTSSCGMTTWVYNQALSPLTRTGQQPGASFLHLII